VRAILIDPRLRRVTDVELSGKTERDQLADMRRLIGANGLDHITISDLGDVLWLDEMGLQRGACWAFRIRDGGPFAGKGIIIGTNRSDGSSQPPIVPLVLIENDITWLDEIEAEVHWEESPVTLPNGATAMRVRSFVTYKRVKR
jgi:hypothetical protein